LVHPKTQAEPLIRFSPDDPAKVTKAAMPPQSKACGQFMLPRVVERWL